MDSWIFIYLVADGVSTFAIFNHNQIQDAMAISLKINNENGFILCNLPIIESTT